MGTRCRSCYSESRLNSPFCDALSGLYPIRYFIKALKDDYKSNFDTQPKNSQENLSKAEREWKIQLNCLQNDLNTYKERLEYFQTRNEKHHVEITKRIILQSEAKLQQHLLER